MATRTKSSVSTIDVSPLYHDFEPFCEWKRGEDLLVVHVPDFKKEQLRVQVNTAGALKISGERTLEGDKRTTRSRFYKEIRVPEGCDINEVHAKLSDGKLTITMPRKTPNNFTPFSSSLASQQEQRVTVQRKFGLEGKEEEMIGFGSFKFVKKIVLNVGIAVVAIASIGAVVFFQPANSSASPSSAAFVKREE